MPRIYFLHPIKLIQQDFVKPYYKSIIWIPYLETQLTIYSKPNTKKDIT